MENIKELWPGWETVRLIGRGSYGAVYEIRRSIFEEEEKAALKVISIPQNNGDIEEMYSDGYDEESISASFRGHLKSIVTEYSIMRKMNGSANVVNCDDIRYVQHEDGIGWDIFIRMELLTPLSKVLSEKPEEKDVLKIALDLTAALELCKKHNIVHRDIKPQNIFISDNDDYKLGDFGIAKTVEKTMGGTKTGTYKYMAPEVYNNQPYGSAADIYSLGLVLYWMLNERRLPFLPFPPAKLMAGMDEEARNRRLSGEPIPAPAHGSEELKRIVLKACAYDPTKRYASATEMRADLLALQNGMPATFSISAAAPAKEAEQATSAFIEAVTVVSDNGDETIGTLYSKETEDVGPIAAEQTADADNDATIGVWDAQRSTEDTDATVGVWNGIEVNAETDDETAVPTEESEDNSSARTDRKKRIRLLIVIAVAIVFMAALYLFVLMPKLTVKKSFNPDGSLQSVTRQTVGGKFKSVTNYKYGYAAELKEYDKNGHLIKTTSFNKDGSTKMYAVYNLDSDGIEAGGTNHDPDDSIVEKWISEHDSNGNIVKRSYYDTDGSPSYYLLNDYDSSGKLIQESRYSTDDALESIKEYDINGNRVKSTYFKADGSVDYYWTVEYDSNGKRTQESRYSADNVLELVNELDADGNVVKRTYFKADGSVDSYYEYEYNSNGNNTKITCYNVDGSINHYLEYEYDSNGNITKSTDYNADGSIHYIGEYDNNGNNIKTTYYNADGSIDFYCEDEYDSSGNNIKTTYYNADGSVDFYYEDEYDSNGNNTKGTYYYADGSINHYNEYEYDSNDNLTKTTVYNADGSIDFVNEYNSNGNWTKSTCYNADGSINHYEEYEYDSSGNRTKSTCYNADGSIDHIYEYDSYGNITKSTYYNADGSIR